VVVVETDSASSELSGGSHVSRNSRKRWRIKYNFSFYTVDSETRELYDLLIIHQGHLCGHCDLKSALQQVQLRGLIILPSASAKFNSEGFICKCTRLLIMIMNEE